MDWQFLIGVGLAVIFGFLAFAVKDMPQWIAWPGVAVGLLLVGWGVLPKREQIQVAPAIVLICALAIAVGCAIVLWQQWRSTTDKDETQPVAPQSTAFFDCGLAPWVEAEDAKDASSIAVTQFGQPKPSLAIASGPVSSHNHSQPYSSLAPLKCQMTFYGKSPLFNVRIPITIEILSIIVDGNRQQSGPLLAALATTITIKQIVIPAKNLVTVYIYGFDVNAAINVRPTTEYFFETEDGAGDFKGKVVESKAPAFTTTFPNVPPPRE